MNNKNYKKLLHQAMVFIIVCGMIISNVMPVYATGASVKKATEVANDISDDKNEDEDDGEILYICTVCGDSRTEAIPRIASVTLSCTKYTYDGKVKKPSVKAVDKKGNVISPIYYTVAYEDNKNAGTATVTVIFKDKYDADIDKEFTIVKASQSISAKISSKSYKKAIVAKKAQTFSIGAKAKCSLSYKFSSKYLTVSSKGSVTVKKGAPKETYKITITTKKSSNYNTATKTVTVKVV